MSPKVKIGLLVAVHIVAGLLLVWARANGLHTIRRMIAGFPIHTVGLFALVFADTGLIGFWGGLSTARFKWRLPAVYVAAMHLAAVLQQKFSAFIMIALTSVSILVILSRLRNSRKRLRLAHLANESSLKEGFQFTIRQLLVITAVVAVVLAIGRGVRMITATQWGDALAVVIYTPCFILVELAMLWAALGIGSPTPRLAIVVPTSFAVGAVPAYYLEGVGHANWQRFVYWSTVVGLQAIITAASLLVVRTCGLRLVSGTGGQGEPPGP